MAKKTASKKTANKKTQAKKTTSKSSSMFPKTAKKTTAKKPVAKKGTLKVNKDDTKSVDKNVPVMPDTSLKGKVLNTGALNSLYDEKKDSSTPDRMFETTGAKPDGVAPEQEQHSL